jgi:hypothetical protein
VVAALYWAPDMTALAGSPVSYGRRHSVPHGGSPDRAPTGMKPLVLLIPLGIIAFVVTVYLVIGSTR